MKDCTFCRISAGELPAHVIYEDEHVLAFMAIHPVNAGHALIIPRAHFSYIEEVDDETYTYLMRISKRLINTIKVVTEAERVGMMVVGLGVRHVHVHVVPIHRARDVLTLKMMRAQLRKPDHQKLAVMAQQLQQALE